MKRALLWAVIAFFACIILGLRLLPALGVTLFATLAGM